MLAALIYKKKTYHTNIQEIVRYHVWLANEWHPPFLGKYNIRSENHEKCDAFYYCKIMLSWLLIRDVNNYIAFTT